MGIHIIADYKRMRSDFRPRHKVKIGKKKTKVRDSSEYEIGKQQQLLANDQDRPLWRLNKFLITYRFFFLFFFFVVAVSAVVIRRFRLPGTGLLQSFHSTPVNLNSTKLRSESPRVYTLLVIPVGLLHSPLTSNSA